MHASRPAILTKGGSSTGAFLWNLQNFWEHLFSRTPTSDCFYTVWVDVILTQKEISFTQKPVFRGLVILWWNAWRAQREKSFLRILDFT